LKKGSVYEDLALIQELSDTITYAHGLRDSVFSLSKALLLFNMNELCVELQAKYEQVVDLVEGDKNEIWDYPTVSGEEATSTIEAYRQSLAANQTEFSKLEIKYRFPPEAASKRTWKLHFYE
jgi:two-component SAPR family response regulator